VKVCWFANTALEILTYGRTAIDSPTYLVIYPFGENASENHGGGVRHAAVLIPEVWGLVIRVYGLGPRVQGLGSRVQGLGFWDKSSGFRVLGLGFSFSELQV